MHSGSFTLGYGRQDSLLEVTPSARGLTTERDNQRGVNIDWHEACRYLDAPISGGVDGATAGTLAVMVGGDAATLTHTASRAPISSRCCGTPWAARRSQRIGKSVC